MCHYADHIFSHFNKSLLFCLQQPWAFRNRRLEHSSALSFVFGLRDFIPHLFRVRLITHPGFVKWHTLCSARIPAKWRVAKRPQEHTLAIHKSRRFYIKPSWPFCMNFIQMLARISMISHRAHILPLEVVQTEHPEHQVSLEALIPICGQQQKQRHQQSR